MSSSTLISILEKHSVMFSYQTPRTPAHYSTKTSLAISIISLLWPDPYMKCGLCKKWFISTHTLQGYNLSCEGMVVRDGGNYLNCIHTWGREMLFLLSLYAAIIKMIIEFNHHKFSHLYFPPTFSSTLFSFSCVISRIQSTIHTSIINLSSLFLIFFYDCIKIYIHCVCVRVYS